MANIDSKKKELFENMPISGAIASLAVPTIISQLVTLAYNLADAWFIGRTGNPLMIAAVSLIYPVFMMTTGISNLFGIGGGSLMSRLMGKGELERASKVCSFSFYAALSSAAFYAACILTFEDKILALLGASEATLPFASAYMYYVVMLGGIPTVLSMTLSHFLRNAGYSKEASFGLSMGAALNIVFDPLFMFVILPPGQEVVGAAVATLLSNLISTLYFMTMILRLSDVSVLNMSPSKARLDFEGVKSVISVGLPSGLVIFMFDFASACQNAAMSAHGDLQMAALGIVLKAERLPIAIGLGLSQGTMPLVSYNYSSKNFDRMKRAINMSRLYGIIVGVASIIFYVTCAESVIRLFLNVSKGGADTALMTMAFGVSFLRLRTFGTLFTFLNFHITYMLQALGFARLTFILSSLRMLVCFVGMVFLLNRLFGAMGVVGSQGAAEILTLTFAFPLFIRAIRPTK